MIKFTERGIIMLDEKKRYSLLSNAFEFAADTRLLGGKKSVLLAGAEKLGYTGTLLVFKNPNLSELHLGSHILNGWIMRDTIENPAGDGSGFVICTRETGKVI
jgi:hypothetical protein